MRRDWNKVVISSPAKLRELMLTMSMNQEREINLIAEKIAEKVKVGKIKYIGIAGPSASGKTTFSKKLGLSLKSRGIETIVLGMDDYYKSPKDVPVDEKGVKDFECLEALRIDDFNNDLGRIFKGEPVKRCVFDFVKGEHTYLDDDIMQLPPKDSGKTGVVL